MKDDVNNSGIAGALTFGLFGIPANPLIPIAFGGLCGYGIGLFRVGWDDLRKEILDEYLQSLEDETK
jgi:hypothetical protein